MKALNLQKAAWLTRQGAGAWPAGRIPGTPLTAVPPAWQEFCKRPFDRYPRLDALSKWVAVLAELVLEDVEDKQELGLVMVTCHGCVEADLAYYASAVSTPEFASPQLFPYTLPSAGLAEVTIRHGIVGPSLVFVGSDGMGPAWEQAACWLQTGEAASCMIVAADAVMQPAQKFLQISSCFEGYAFLLGTQPGGLSVRRQPGEADISASEMMACLQQGTFSHPGWEIVSESRK